MRSVYWKEIVIYFTSPIFYVVAGIFLLLSGIFFFNDLTYVGMVATQIAQYQGQAGVSISDILLRPLFADISLLVLFVVPVLAMRLYAEEKSQGTMELLFTYPLSDHAVLGGKYLAGLTVLVVMLAATFVFVGILAQFTTPDWGVVVSAYLGIALMAATFLALGVFASSLSRNQIVAAVITLGLILGFWMCGWVARALPAGMWRTLFEELSITAHLSSFLRGMITLKDVVFYVFFSLFFLFATVRVLEGHTWRG